MPVVSGQFEKSVANSESNEINEVIFRNFQADSSIHSSNKSNIADFDELEYNKPSEIKDTNSPSIIEL